MARLAPDFLACTGCYGHSSWYHSSRGCAPSPRVTATIEMQLVGGGGGGVHGDRDAHTN